MELRHLSGFVAVAEELSFGRAASRLHVSQPAVSRLIRQLETELGVLLLDRSTHHVDVTPAGRAFLREARIALGQVEVAGTAARQAARAQVTTLHVGHTECSDEVVSAVLRRFRRDLPAVRLDVRQVNARSQPRALLAGALDVVVRRASVDDVGVDTQVVGHEPMALALPKGHPLAAAEALTVASLASSAFVVLPGSPSHERLAMLCDRLGFQPKVAEEASSLASLGVLVASGIGLAAVPASVARRFGDSVICRPLEATGALLPVVVAWRRDDVSTAVRGFIRAARAVNITEAVAVSVAASG